MLLPNAAENETRIVPIGQKWPLARTTRAGYRDTARIKITSQRRFVGDCATCQRRASVAKRRTEMGYYTVTVDQDGMETTTVGDNIHEALRHFNALCKHCGDGTTYTVTLWDEARNIRLAYCDAES